MLISHSIMEKTNGKVRQHHDFIYFFLICFLASTAGAICGIGGGVIINPLWTHFTSWTFQSLVSYPAAQCSL